MADEIKEEVKEEVSLIEQAKQAAETLKAIQAETKILVEKYEKMKANELLGGKSEAGVIPKEPSKEEKNKTFINDILKSTGLKI